MAKEVKNRDGALAVPIMIQICNNGDNDVILSKLIMLPCYADGQMNSDDGALAIMMANRNLPKTGKNHTKDCTWAVQSTRLTLILHNGCL